MITEMEKRKYTLRKRAENQEETRARIVEATMALHEELGPRHTTVSAISERAGVQRLTVYRHFPDDAALFQACTSCWLERHPPPPAVQPRVVPDREGCRHGLEALYRYYRANRRMLAASYRDVDVVEAMQEPMRNLDAYVASYRDALLACWKLSAAAKRRAQPVLTLAVSFASWQTLEREGQSDAEMANLVLDWLASLSAAQSGRATPKAK